MVVEQRTRKQAGIRAIVAPGLTNADIVHLDGVPVTSLERTVVDLSAELTVGQLVRCIREAAFRRKVEGEWRELEAQRLLNSGVWTASTEDEAEIMHRVQYRAGQEKIQYWGMSYGTVLGATFAAMHPDRVGRIILDGVVDPADHYSGRWLTQLQDSDKIVTQFCAYCFEAGPTKCPFYTGPSPADVEARLTSILLCRGLTLAPESRHGVDVLMEINGRCNAARMQTVPQRIP